MILVCSNGQSNLQDKQSSKQGTSSSSLGREPSTWRFEKIELEKQIKDWKKRYDELQEEAKKASVSVISVDAETESVKAKLDAVS